MEGSSSRFAPRAPDFLDVLCDWVPGLAGGVTFKVDTEGMRPSRLSDKSRGRARALVAGGVGHIVSLESDTAIDSAESTYAGFNFTPPTAALPDMVATVGVSIGGAWLPHPWDGWLDQFVAQALDLASLGDFASFTISRGHRSFNLSTRSSEGRHAYRFLSEVSWATWLTEGHLEALGGRERVLADAPVAKAREAAGGVLLLATDDPDAAGREELWPLVEFLTPLVRTSDADLAAYDESIGYVKPTAAPGPSADPVWLFDGVDPSAPVPIEYTGPVELDTFLGVVLHGPGSDEARAVVDRVVRDWGWVGVDGGLGAGFLHGVHPDPAIEADHYDYSVDLGSLEDLEGAFAELARRLGRCSEAYVPIQVLRIGPDQHPEIDD